MSEKEQGTTRATGSEHHAPPSVSPKWAKRILTAFWAGCVILLAFDFFYDRHTEHSLEEIPGFYALYGFVGVAVLIVLAKELRKIVARGEDYYGE